MCLVEELSVSVGESRGCQVSGGFGGIFFFFFFCGLGPGQGFGIFYGPRRFVGRCLALEHHHRPLLLSLLASASSLLDTF